jgi:3-oxoacyl-[acyl-carrier protein] reductase
VASSPAHLRESASMFASTRIAVVTGASTGIGRSIALRLAREGWAVVVNAIRDGKAGEEVVATIHRLGMPSTFCQADVSTDDGARAVIAAAAEMGSPTLLVNNAGATRPRALGQWDADHWRDMLATNLVTTALMTEHFLRQCHQDDAAIVNIASVRGVDGAGRPGIAAYCAAKAGVINLTQTLAAQLAPRVTVNCISPGFVQTAYMDRVSADQVLSWRSSMPTERFVAADAVAEAVVFLAAQRDLTGSNLVLDGGWSAARA